MTEVIAAAKIDVAAERLKPRLQAIFFCDFFSQTKEGKNNLLGTFDLIRVDRTLKKTPDLILFVRLLQVPVGLVAITIFGPGNEPIGNLWFKNDASSPAGQCGHSTDITPKFSFETAREGVYWLDVSYNGVSIGGTSLTVEFRDPLAEAG